MKADRFVLETLAHFVRSADGPPPGVPARVDAGFETRLAAVCAEQGLSPVVSRSLDRLALPPSISRVTAVRLRTHAAAIEAETVRRRSLAARLVERLGAEGIDALLMGEVLATATYPQPGIRPVPVIDILVHEHDVARAMAALARTGYGYTGTHPVFGARRSEGRVSDRRAEELVWYHHYIAPLFLTAGDDVAVRLRTRVVDLGHPAPEELAWERRASIEIGEVEVGAICMEDHLIERCIRAGMAAMADLGSLVDIALAARANHLDWERVSSRARSAGVLTAVTVVLNEVGSLFHIQKPARRLPAAAPLGAVLIRRWWGLEHIDYAELPSPRAGRFRFGLLASGGPVSGTRWVSRHIFPRRRWIRNLLGGRTTLWRWLKFLLIARDFPVHAGLPAMRDEPRDGTVIDFGPGKRR